MKSISILIVDDREIIRDSLKVILSRVEDIYVKDEASDGFEAINLVKKNNYDVVLIDVNMPVLNGVEATKQIVKHNSNIKILANSFCINPYDIKDIIKAGASGFITKDESMENYIEAIRKIHRGEIYLSDKINHKDYDKVLTYFNHSV